MTHHDDNSPHKDHAHLMGGRTVDPLQLGDAAAVKDFIDRVFGHSGFNARRLAEACRLYDRMIQEDATVCLTLAGAMTPIGMSGVVVELMKRGLVDFIIATGANLYHDLHRPYGCPVVQGEADVDDEYLQSCGVARIYDTFIGEEETLLATDNVILKAISGLQADGPISTADLHYFIGQKVLEEASDPEGSILATASRLGVPVFTSSPGDSSVGMNVAMSQVFGQPVVVDPSLDVLETTALVWLAKKNGAIEVGGGSPKNFYMQTQPMLWQFLDSSRGGHDYFIQLTTDSPHWGGLSGATPSEAKSWGKIQVGQEKNSVVVYSCASITFPLLAQYILSTGRSRPQKDLYGAKDQAVADLKKAALNNPDMRSKSEWFDRRSR